MGWVLLDLQSWVLVTSMRRGGLPLQGQYTFSLNFVHKEKLFDAPHENEAVHFLSGTNKKEPLARSFLLVPEAGVEPASLARHDFKSCAYTNSATRAYILPTWAMDRYYHILFDMLNVILYILSIMLYNMFIIFIMYIENF